MRKNVIDKIREQWQVSVNRYRNAINDDERMIHYGSMKACEELLERIGAVKMMDIDNIILNEEIKRRLEISCNRHSRRTTTIASAGNR